MVVETPLHPEAAHKHTTDRIIRCLDARANWWKVHQCACGTTYMMEPD